MINSDDREVADNQYSRGLSYITLQEGDRQAAIQTYRRVLALRPEDEAARRTLARLESGADR